MQGPPQRPAEPDIAEAATSLQPHAIQADRDRGCVSGDRLEQVRLLAPAGNRAGQRPRMGAPLGVQLTDRAGRVRAEPDPSQRDLRGHPGVPEGAQAEQRLAPVRYQLALAYPQAGSPQHAKTEMEVDGAGLPQGQRRPAPCQPDGQCYLGIISAQVGDKGAARWALSVAAASLTPFPGQGEARKALAAIDT